MKLSRFLLAVGCVTASLGVSGASRAQDPVAAAAPTAAGVNPLSSLDLESLDATRSLPLFTPSRSPPPVVEEPEVVIVDPPPPPPPSPPDLDLVGVVASGSTELALLRDRNTGEVHRLSAGEEYAGWAIIFVDARTVEFRNGEHAQKLTMFDNFGTFGDAGAFGLPSVGPGDAMTGVPAGFIDVDELLRQNSTDYVEE